MAASARSRFLVAFLILLPVPGVEVGRQLEAQLLGPELEIANKATGAPFHSGVAADRTGRFVVVWKTGESGDEADIVARRYDPQDLPLGSDFVVNELTTSRQDYPRVDTDGSGRFVVVWNDSGRGVGRRFDVSGAPLGGEFGLNSNSNVFLRPIAVSANDSGTMACLWKAYGVGCGVFGCTMARRFAADGTPTELDFPVSYSWLFASNYADDIAMTGESEFVVTDAAISSYQGQYNVSDAAVSRYTAGSQQATAVSVDSPSNQLYSYPPARVASNEGGSFVVAWTSFSYPAAGPVDIRVQPFDRELNPLSDPIVASTDTVNAHGGPDLAVDRKGNFVVVWESSDQDGSGSGIFAQRFAADGSRIGSEFQVNSYTTGDQRAPEVAVGNAGDFIVSWNSFGHGGSGHSLAARRIRSSMFWGGFELGDPCGWSAVVGAPCG